MKDKIILLYSKRKKKQKIDKKNNPKGLLFDRFIEDELEARNMYSSRSDEVEPNHVDTEDHKDDEKEEIDATFYSEVFVSTKTSYFLNNNTKETSSVECWDRKKIEKCQR